MGVSVCFTLMHLLPIPVAVQSKVELSSRSIVGIADLKPAEDMDVRPLCCLCVV